MILNVKKVDARNKRSGMFRLIDHHLDLFATEFGLSKSNASRYCIDVAPQFFCNWCRKNNYMDMTPYKISIGDETLSYGFEIEENAMLTNTLLALRIGG